MPLRPSASDHEVATEGSPCGTARHPPLAAAADHADRAPADKKEIFVRTLFDRIGPRYDLFNRLVSLGLDQGFRRRAVAAASLRPGLRVLDLGAGTGDLTLLAAAAVAPTGIVVAFDLSLSMLRLATVKADRVPPGYHARYLNGRAEQLPIPDGTFDAVVSGFVMRNVSDVARTLSEGRRVLRRGGQLAILEFGRPDSAILRWGQTLWLAIWALAVGWLVTGARWPFAYLRRSVATFLKPEAFMKQMRAAGFSGVAMTPLMGGAAVIYRGVA